MALYKTGNPVPSSAMPDVWDNNHVQDIMINSDKLEVETRTGKIQPTWSGIVKINADAIKEAQDSITILGLPFTTLAEAQAAADDGKIPVGAITWVRNAGDASLADEYINNGGTLQPTGRKMPSGAAVELMSDTVQRLMTALYVMAESGTSSGSDLESSDTVQNLMTGFNVLAESINNLSVGNQQNASGLSRLVSSVQICTEMLNTLAAEVVTPDGASQYGYAAFSVPGTVSASNGSFGTDTRYRRTGMIPVRKGDVVRLIVYTTSATAGHAAALYDSSGAYVGPLGIMCASYAAYQARYYQCEIS
ncbi:TPA: hypothetical protein RRE30_002588, partial [Klebsiella pneumoniae]|nr:hypothetical protein [Klebsiella pneumoniae]